MDKLPRPVEAMARDDLRFMFVGKHPCHFSAKHRRTSESVRTLKRFEARLGRAPTIVRRFCAYICNVMYEHFKQSTYDRKVHTLQAEYI